MNNTINENGNDIASAQYRPSLSFYHPNAKGTGCALRLELHPAHDRTDGSIMLSAANQMSIGDRNGPKPTYARFDWEHKVSIKLDFSDLSKMLQVFRGETESLEEGHGLIHVSPTGKTKIMLRHLVEPVSGYSFELYRTARSGEESNIHFNFRSNEALGLCESISGAMSVIAFGIPVVIPHDVSAYRAQVKESRNAAA